MTTYNDPWAGIRQLQFRKQTIDHPAWSDQGDPIEGWSESVWGADQDTLNAGGYNSMYQVKRPEEVRPGFAGFATMVLGELRYDGLLVCIDPRTTGTGDVQNAAIALASLANNGGPTQSHLAVVGTIYIVTLPCHFFLHDKPQVFFVINNK